MFGFAKPAAPQLDAATAQTLAAQGKLTLIDVREASEIAATGKAKGALHVPLALLPLRADPRHPDHDPALSPDRPVAIYCASGGRSQMAVSLLQRLGYSEVHNLGGLGDLRAAGCTMAR